MFQLLPEIPSGTSLSTFVYSFRLLLYSAFHRLNLPHSSLSQLPTSTTMAVINVKPTMRTLRTITMFLIIPGLPLIIPTAILGYPVILAGLAPYSVSLVLGIAHRECNRRKKEISAPLAALLELFATLAYMGSLLPMWTGPGSALHRFQSNYYWDDRTPQLMLFCYASSVYVANM